MATLEALLSSLSEKSNEKGKDFGEIAKWFLENSPLYLHELKKVWRWKEWPGRWGPDTGVDLVAETKSGDLWAIQANNYSRHYSVTKKDIYTFLSESGGSTFSFRLLIATTDLMGRNALRAMKTSFLQANQSPGVGPKSRSMDNSAWKLRKSRYLRALGPSWLL